MVRSAGGACLPPLCSLPSPSAKQHEMRQSHQVSKKRKRVCSFKDSTVRFKGLAQSGDVAKQLHCLGRLHSKHMVRRR